MTHMLAGRHKQQAIKAMQRGTFMAHMQQERNRIYPPGNVDRLLRKMAKNLKRWMYRLGQRMGRGIVAGLQKPHMQHHMIGSLSRGTNGYYQHREFTEGLDKYGLKPLPPFRLYEVTQDGGFAGWAKGDPTEGQ